MAIESKLSRGPIGRPIGQPEEPKKRNNHWLWVIIVLIIIVGGVVWWYYGGRQQMLSDSVSGVITSGEYQAVFLDNGQVYFGKLKTSAQEFYTLTDVYYLQTGAAGLDQTSNLSLVKLGNEAHGPEDKMEINKEHVLFVEDMKSESKVVKAIQDYKNKKK